MILQKITNWCLILAAALVPLFFLPWPLDPLEINKQALLTILVTVALLASAGTLFFKKEISLRKNLVNVVLPLFLILLAISAWLSKNFFLSWIGTSSQEYTSFFSLFIFAIYFWQLGATAKEPKTFSRVILSFIIGATVVGLVGLLSVFKIFLPFSFAQTQAFNLIGTLNACGIFLAAVSILANANFLSEGKKGKTLTVFTIGLSIITFAFLAVVNYWVNWTVLLVGLVTLLLLVFLRANEFNQTKKYLLSMFLTAGAILFLFFPNWQIISLPIEVTPNFDSSFSVAKQTLSGSNLWFGSGPGTYSFDYALYRSSDINQSNFWNLRFDRGYSEVLTMLPTKGLLPTLILSIFALIIGVLALKTLFKKSEKQWLSFTVFPAWIALVVAFFIYPANFTLVFVFFLLSGLIFSLAENKKIVFHLTKTPRKQILLSIGFTLLAVVSVTTIFLVTENLTAEFTFAKAVKLDRAGGDLKEVAKLIDRAASINRFNDTFYRNLAETLFLELKTESSQIGTTQPNEDQSKYLQALIAASINAGKQATELEPRNVVNWLELASLYRTYALLIPNVDAFALQASQTATNLEPQNPTNYVGLGQTYLALAVALEPITTSEDETTKQTAVQKRTEYFTAAEAAFNKAITLKSDYAPAHYQLALAYEQEGRLGDAITKMESINKYNPQDVGVAFELGILYLRRLDTNDLSKAETAFKQAITLMPSYSNAHWYLAFVYEQQNNIPAAIYEVEAVANLNPDNEMVKTRLERLKSGQTTPVTETAPLE